MVCRTMRFCSRGLGQIANIWGLLGSPWGAGTLAGGDGSRQPSPLEIEIAQAQGKQFYTILSRVKIEPAKVESSQ